MFSLDAAFPWLATTAGICLVVLGIGSVLTWCWTRPVERLRCIQTTFVALLAACAVQQFSLLPQVSLGWLPVEGDREPDTLATAAPAESRPVAGSLAAPSADHAWSSAMESAAGVNAAFEADTTPMQARNIAAPAEDAVQRAAADQPAVIGRSVRVAALWVFAAGAGWSVINLALGVLRLRKLRRTCVPAPAAVAALVDGLELPHRRRLTILLSPAIEVPLTYGVRRATIVLPTSMVTAGRRTTLRNCLAHELSHVHRHDVAQWWALQALQPLLWYQPLYWVLRRELRLCQDQIADHFASAHAADALSYAEVLVELAKFRHCRQAGLALTMSHGRSNLYRRIQLLVSANRHLASVCRYWAVGVAATVLIAAGGALATVNLGRAETFVAPADDSDKSESEKQPIKTASDTDASAKGTTKEAPKQESVDATQKSAAEPGKQPDVDPSVLGEELPDGSLRYSGAIIDKATKKPIEGAVVTVRRMALSSWDRRILEETKHTTDAAGRYSFVLPPEQVADRFLYIELDVEHADYATKAGFGYALSMIRKNAELNDPPFFARVMLDPAEALTGRIVGPDGQPLADVPLLAYSNANPRDFGNDNYGSFFHAKSAADGTFRLNLIKEGPSVFWIVPEKYAPRQIVSGTKRGEWGDVQIEEGVRVSGQVVDAAGKPMPDVWVNVTDNKSRQEIQMPVASALRRSAQTDADGKFELGPVKPGQFELEVEGYPSEIRYRSRDRKRVEIPAIFPRRTITIGEDAQQLLLVRAVPHVQFEGQYVDSKGEKKSGWSLHVVGRIDGEFYFGQLRPDADGKIVGMLPHGMERTELDVVSNEHGAIRVRLGKDKPLVGGRDIQLGTIESDITDVEIIRYTAPIVQLKAVDEAGQPVDNIKVAGIYEGQHKGELRNPVGGIPTNIYFEKQPNGVFRTSQMLPDEEVRFVAKADGYEDAEETLSLPEGKTREVTLVLRRSKTSEDATAAPKAKSEDSDK
ncbi:MAG: M56 family metallopeptidase [Pirellulales bacterium]